MHKWNIKKVAFYLFIIMITSLTIGAILLQNTLGQYIKPKDLNQVDEKKELVLEGININTIAINTDNADVQLFTTNEPKITAHLDGNYSLKDDSPVYSFVLHQTENRVNIDVRKIKQFVFSHNDTKLTVYLPSSFKGKLNVSTASGDCKFDQVKDLEEFTFRTSSGDLIANSVYAKLIKLSSASGELELNGACRIFSADTASGEFTTQSLVATSALMNTASGNFNVIGEFKDFQFKSASGDLISDSFKSDTTKINTASGRATLKGTPGNIEAKTMSGDLSLSYMDFRNDITARTMSGNVDIKIPNNSNFSVSFKSASGTIKVSEELTENNTKITTRKHFKGSFGDDNNKISINTASGDLKISDL